MISILTLYKIYTSESYSSIMKSPKVLKWNSYTIERIDRASVPVAGCESVVVFDHTLRESNSTVGLNALGNTDTAVTPVKRVHCDYTETSGSKRVVDILMAANKKKKKTASFLGSSTTADDDVAEEATSGAAPARSNEEEEEEGDVSTLLPDFLRGRRFAIVNVWRSAPGAGTIQREPLAVCDPSSVEDDDRVHYEMIYPDRVGGNYALTHTPRHRWMYYPQMTEDEALLFKVGGWVELPVQVELSRRIHCNCII